MSRFHLRAFAAAAVVFWAAVLCGHVSSRAEGLDARDLERLRLAHIEPPIEAPDFKLRTLDRNELALRDLRGRGVLLYFWATW